MKTNKELKEKALKSIALVIRHWFNRDVDFKVAHKEIGDVIDSTISQTRQEVIEESIDEFWNDEKLQEAISLYGEWNGSELNKAFNSAKKRVLKKLSNKEK